MLGEVKHRYTESDIGRQEGKPLDSEGIVGKQIHTENSYVQETRSHSFILARKCTETGASGSDFLQPLTQLAAHGIDTIHKSAVLAEKMNIENSQLRLIKCDSDWLDPARTRPSSSMYHVPRLPK